MISRITRHLRMLAGDGCLCTRFLCWSYPTKAFGTLVSIFASLLLLGSLMAAEPTWQHVPITREFLSEGVAVGDFNHDGQWDVAAGDFWFAAPNWQRFPVRPMKNREGQPTDHYDGSKGYSNTFAQWSYDINRDGWDDLIIVGFPGAPCYWYQNPRHTEGFWPEYQVWHSACNETPYFTDLNGDGRPELLLGSQPERQMGYLPIPDPDRVQHTWAFHPLSDPGDPMKNGTFMYYHGLGVGDINGDGRLDVLIPHGGYLAPHTSGGSWSFVPWTLAPDGQPPLPSSNLYTLDLDLDGDQDIVTSSAHRYGVWWFENLQQSPAQPGPFRMHLIDESFSQSHALWLGDLQGDGIPTIVTGKRFFAHNGVGDPGEHEPVVMMTYRILRQPGQPPRFERREIVEGQNTGVGTQFQVFDLDRNGKLDLILSNKKGVHLLLQQ
ncbi:MAG: hypothetical protein KatS3mg114_0539 [Planctomycetaceae bacterium]|nr:MAG: hypothetical protein KatS3mg114_0539 [Planctomycetaceae bacterium]